jgi:hypothetical protein
MRHHAIVSMIAVLMVAYAAAITTAQTSITQSRDYLADPSLSEAQNFSGVWQLENYTPKLLPVDANSLPFTKEGKLLFDNNAKDLKKSDAAHRRCVPLGTPRAFISPYPFLIVQSAERLLALFEQNRTVIGIYMNSDHKDSKIWDPSFVGDGIAHWEGDELVADIVNQNGQGWIDDSGVPTSEKLHVIERWKKAGSHLEVTLTIDDPVIFTRPWTARMTYAPRPGVEVEDGWVCDEPHRSVANVKGAAAYFPDSATKITR